MADYIKREDVLSLKRRLYNHSKDTIELYPVYVISPDAVEKIPSADVQPVVRCKDCSHGFKTSYPSELRICLTTGCAHSENHFCSDGKRMDGGTNS